MCGIAGLVSSSLDQARLSSVLRRMSLAIAHRGPDDDGIYETRNRSNHYVGLVHRRLSIIDLSSAGHQPMSNGEGTVWIVFNGEIYNYRELRKMLEKYYRFESSTDTEVILHLYEAQGVRCVEQLNGIFAFAIYDARPESSLSNCLFLARDHVGVKPLYYSLLDRQFQFGSEIKAILESLSRSPTINWQAVWDYFTFLYIPHPDTIYDGIYHLPPGHWAIYNPEKREVEITSYWNPVARAAKEQKKSLPKKLLEESLRSLLEDAVNMQMVSDVPIGAFLSGGIDSSIVVGLMAKATSKPLKTFTVLFKGDGAGFYNEKKTADAVAHRWGTEHYEIQIDISLPEELFNLITIFDQPFGNPTFYLSYLISQFTRNHVKVALSGAGGDELFAGYPRYLVIPFARRTRYAPILLSKLARQVVDRLPYDYGKPTMRRVKLFFDGIDPDYARQYQNWTYFFNEDEKKELLDLNNLSNSEASVRVLKKLLREAEAIDVNNRIQFVDVKSYLVDNILEYTDRSSMAVSLEVRVPLLDYRLVEFGLALPFHFKINKGVSKAILRQCCADLIPSENLRGPKKGFCPPLANWMITLDKYFDTHLTLPYTKREGILQWDMIQKLRAEHKSGKRDRSMELFGIIMFDVWYRKYILGSERSI